ncbi:AAA family ATPase [Noviherbaspirillum malthae]|uniref:AAA family ATPase n=1 Tax=Noviherbaspirillum malthae TaxID=1260987 RepID=UPI00188F06EC|nr:AAA family ATPase [Noviherbaspirillum malthae]
MRSTFALQDEVIYRLKAVAALLHVSENTLRNHLRDSGLEIQRANRKNPASPAVRLFSIGDVFRLAQWRREQELIKKVASSPIVIAVDLIKGGVGKSTTAGEVGIQLALQGYRVLMIDLDVQSNLTQLLGYESDLTVDEAAEHDLHPDAIVTGTFATICTQFMDSKNGRGTKLQDVSSLIKHPFGPAGPALIASDTFLGDLEQAFTYAKGNRELVFRQLFHESAAGHIPGFNVAEYDFVIFDCPPSISFSSTNAIAAADIILAPIRMDSFAVKGLSRLVSEINGLRERSPEIRPQLLILPTHYSTNIRRVSRMQQQLQAYKDNLSPTVISSSELFPKTQENYLPLTLQQPTAAPVAEYRLFTEFLLTVAAKVKGKTSVRAMES